MEPAEEVLTSMSVILDEKSSHGEGLDQEIVHEIVTAKDAVEAENVEDAQEVDLVKENEGLDLGLKTDGIVKGLNATEDRDRVLQGNGGIAIVIVVVGTKIELRSKMNHLRMTTIKKMIIISMLKSRQSKRRIGSHLVMALVISDY